MAIFVIGVCLRQTPSIRRRRIAMETAASMPRTPVANFLPQSQIEPKVRSKRSKNNER
jgi:hypothetical protein